MLNIKIKLEILNYDFSEIRNRWKDCFSDKTRRLTTPTLQSLPPQLQRLQQPHGRASGHS